MTAPRQKVNYNLDPADHAALKVFAKAGGNKTLAVITEEIVKEWISKRVGETSVLANELQRAGIIRNGPESPGITGKGHK